MTAPAQQWSEGYDFVVDRNNFIHWKQWENSNKQTVWKKINLQSAVAVVFAWNFDSTAFCLIFSRNPQFHCPYAETATYFFVFDLCAADECLISVLI